MSTKDTQKLRLDIIFLAFYVQYLVYLADSIDKATVQNVSSKFEFMPASGSPITKHSSKQYLILTGEFRVIS